MKRLLFPIILILSSCASTMQPIGTKKMLESWVGQPESKLIQEWGLPDAHMTNENGQKIYEYRKVKQAPLPPLGGGVGSPIGSMVDKYTFFIVDNVIVSNSYKRSH